MTAVIDPPIPTAGLTGADADRLRAQVYDLIAGRVMARGGRVG